MTRAFLLLHGMCCTGAVWDNFRGFYEARGVRVFAPTLRPELRVRKRPPRDLHALRLADYEADVERELSRIEQLTGGPVTVIGHSLGGLLAQTLAERNRPNAAVFISPSPPADVRTPLSTRFWWGFRRARKLGLVPGALYPYRFVTDRIAFNRVPPAQRALAHAQMVHESREVFADVPARHIDETKIRIPTLTISARRDRLVTPDLVRLTGKKYERVGGTFKEYREHAHWLYGEPGWETPAADILAWVEANT